MEVETWFLALSENFVKIHAKYTHEYIVRTLTYDPNSINLENQILHPFADLNNLMSISGGYNKSKSSVEKILKCIPLESVKKLVNSKKVKHFNRFLRQLKQGIPAKYLN